MKPYRTILKKYGFTYSRLMNIDVSYFVELYLYSPVSLLPLLTSHETDIKYSGEYHDIEDGSQLLRSDNGSIGRTRHRRGTFTDR